MTDSIRGLGAYNRALEASKNIKPSAASQLDRPMSILRKGDDMTVAQNNVESFPEILDKIIVGQTEKIKGAEKKINEITNSNPINPGMGTDLVELVSAVNEAEVALQTIVVIRDRFIAAQQDVFKMVI